MSQPVTIKEVPRFGDEFARMQVFAKSFDHYLNPFLSQRIFELSKGERTFGYCDVLYIPTVFPAFHPGAATPRDVVESLNAWRHAHQVAHGGEIIMGIPLAEDRRTFPEPLLGKMGFTRMKREIYSSTLGA